MQPNYLFPGLGFEIRVVLADAAGDPTGPEGTSCRLVGQYIVCLPLNVEV
jgi:hypothetical protein